jgi:hypothetical protein
MQAAKDSNKGNHVACRQRLSLVEESGSECQYADYLMMVIKEGGTGRLYPRVTIDGLPDNALLETFEFYLGKDNAIGINYGRDYDEWQTLVHVCHRWRCIAFVSARRLDLKLYCTRRRSVNSRTLDIWPALPIVIFARDMQSKEDVTNIIAALRQHSRVCKIYYIDRKFQGPLLKEFAAMDEPFPVLRSLKLIPSGQNVPVLPDSFLGGSAPRLRSLDLVGTSYLSIGKLLSSTTNLVRLSLCRIPPSGYIAPETIVPCLSTLPRLKSLELGFQYPRSRAHRERRHPPPLTCVVVPNLTFLTFNGDMEYLEDILSRIEAPILNQSELHFFNQLVFDTPLLGHFVRRTETFMTIHRARVQFFGLAVGVTLSGRDEMANNYREVLHLEITCKPLDWQLSTLVQVLNPFLSSLQTLESLEIAVSHEDWQGEIEIIQWRELLHPFTSVTKMSLVREDSVRLVAPALKELAEERAMEVLPALQNIFLRTYDWQPRGPAEEAIEQFIATRQLYGRPVTIHN